MAVLFWIKTTMRFVFWGEREEQEKLRKQQIRKNLGIGPVGMQFRDTSSDVVKGRERKN